MLDCRKELGVPSRNAPRRDRLLAALALLVSAHVAPTSADELSSDWCAFRTTIKGTFDLMLEDPQARISHANQYRSDYLATWVCEGVPPAPLPEKADLCSAAHRVARALNARMTECIFERDPLNRFVTALVFMKAPNRTILNAVYVARKSKLTLSLTNYSLSHDEQLELFEQLIARIQFGKD
jgi:hypothetical protein